MKLGVAIQTHPARTEMASALAALLPGSVQVYDPMPQAKQRSAWRTYRWALERTLVPSSDWTHVLVIQDDAQPCRHLLDVLGELVPARPDALLALFHSSVPIQNAVRMREAAAQGVPLCVVDTQQWVPVVGTVWPADRIQETLEWVDRQPWPAEFTADDEIVGRAARVLGIPALATVPCLVQHPDTEPSISGNRKPSGGKNPQRVAVLWEPDRDFRGIDWTQPPYERRW